MAHKQGKETNRTDAIRRTALNHVRFLLEYIKDFATLLLLLICSVAAIELLYSFLLWESSTVLGLIQGTASFFTVLTASDGTGGIVAGFIRLGIVTAAIVSLWTAASSSDFK